MAKFLTRRIHELCYFNRIMCYYGMKSKLLSRILFFLAELIRNYVISTDANCAHYFYSGMKSKILSRILFFFLVDF